MRLTVAERDDFRQIAQQVYPLWSAGLMPDDYRYLLLSTFYQVWAKNNHYRLVYKNKNRVIASCKVVHLPFFLRGKYYKMLGLGAIYTAQDWRGQGLATKLVKSVIEKAKQEDIAVVLLFSDIGKDFYGACGFEGLGSLNFELDPRIYSFNATRDAGPIDFEYIHSRNISIEIRSAETLCAQARTQKSNGECAKFHFSSLSPWLTEDECLQLVRCHSRWLARQPYGIIRQKDYFAFKLANLLYLFTYSRKNRPPLFLTILRNGDAITGYAFTECSGTTLRILELIGDDVSRAYLWQSLLKQAQKMNLLRISGFESAIRDFVPRQQIDQALIICAPPINASSIKCYERAWGQPMYLAIDKQMENLSIHNPCPLLEFDYF